MMSFAILTSKKRSVVSWFGFLSGWYLMLALRKAFFNSAVVRPLAGISRSS